MYNKEDEKFVEEEKRSGKDVKERNKWTTLCAHFYSQKGIVHKFVVAYRENTEISRLMKKLTLHDCF